jgi:hypothetical protein
MRARARCWLLASLLLALLLAAALLPLRVAAQTATPAPALLRVAADETIQGNVATVGQDILVEGTVQGDVTSWSGDITVSGQVTGDVVSYLGRIDVAASAAVQGNLLALAGDLRSAPGAQVAGQVIDTQIDGALMSSMLALDGEPGFQLDSWLAYLLFSVLLLLLTLTLAGLGLTSGQRRTRAAAQAVRYAFWRVLGLGLLTTLLLALLLLPLAALLSLTLVGLPFILALLVLLQAGYICGLVVVLLPLTRRVGPTMAAVSGLVGLLLAVGALAPLVSGLLFSLLASPGVGALILSRGGALVPVPPQPG